MTGEIFSVESFVWTCLWQSMVLVAAGLAASFLLRRRSSRAHQVLLLSIIAAVIVPIVSTAVKHYELGMFIAEPVAMQSHLENQVIASDHGPLGPIVRDFADEPVLIEAGVPPVITGSQSAPLPWARIALYGWIGASLILATRLIVTFALGVRLLGRSQPLDCEKMGEAVRSARARLGIGKNVEVRSSRGVRSPVIWCWRRRPVLLMPSRALHCDNSVDWTGVLCHELAHWKRRDHISGLLAEMAVCMLPWNLLLWWAKSRLTSLSEQACDDWVLATGQPGTDYAESLLDLAPGGQMAFVPAVVSSKKGLAGRIRRILKDSCGNPRLGTKWILSAAIVTICIAMTVAFAQTRPANINNIEDEAQRNTLKIDTLPDGWTLDYDNGLMPNGGRRWRANMAENLLELKAIPTPANEYDESWKEERLELHLRSQQGGQISTISIKDDRTGNRIILTPGQYSLLYTRAKKDPDTSLFIQIESVEFPFVLSRPGMYELKFRPKLETSEAVESGTYPSAICTGTVIDSEGNLVNEADVAAYEMFFDRAGNINLRFVSEAITKSDGKLAFEITPSVQKNRSRGGIVVARKEGLAIGWAHWSLYGNQEIKITLQEPTRLSGEVIDENNKSIPNAEVRAVLFEKKSSQEDETRWLPGIKPLDWISVRTDRNGRFEFNNIPENVRSGLLVSAPGLGTIYSCKPDGQGGYESIMFETGTTDIEITVSAEAIIEGKLIDEETGAGIAGETLAVVPHFIPVFFERYLCTTQNDGTFNIGALRSGKYVIRRVGQNSTRIDILAESGKTISDVIIKCPRDIQNTEAVSDIVFPNRNHLPAVARPGSPETKAVQPEYIPGYHQLPDSWSLDYESSFSPDKIKNISTNIGGNLASLEVLPRPTDITDDSWKNEKFEFRIRSLDGARIGDISVRPKSEFSEMEHKIFQPGKYLLSYERGYGKPGNNYRMKSGAFLLDMSLPGMYELNFTPKLGNAEISGLAGGCYAVNFERTGSGIPTRGLAYINREKEYRLDGLSPGTYRLSAVAQQQTGNVIVSQAQVTIEHETKVTVDIAPPPKGNCSLKGSILGRQKTYTFNTPDSHQSQGRWFVLIRRLGSGIIKTTNAYEAQTMDSLYAVRGRNIVQDTEEKASYTIEGIVPGEYTVTAMENPWYSGSVITRQQSKRLTIRPAENVLDFDLRITPQRNPGAKADKEDSGEASARSDEPAAEGVHKEALVQRSYKLRNYSPTKMSQIIKPMLGDFGHLSSDEETGMLLIIDTVERLTRIEKIIAHFDVRGAEPCVTDTFKIYFGDPSDIARKVARLLTGLPNEQITSAAPASTSLVVGPSGQPVALTPDLTGKRILVTGAVSGEDMRQIAGWIEELDKPEKIVREYETVRLGYGNAREVAERLKEAIRQMPGTELQQGVLIQPLTDARQIIIFGRKDLREMVKKLIVEIDVPSGLFETRAFKLKYADPNQVEENIEALYERQPDRVRAISHPTMQQVTVIASPENMLKIADKIAEWDVPLDLEQIKPRIFTLRNSDPSRVARLLTTLFAGKDGEGEHIYEVIFGKDAEGERKTVGPVSRQLTFEAVPGTKKIIVISNFGEAYDIVEKLIFELDRQEIVTQDIEQIDELIAKLVSEVSLRGSNVSGAGVTGLVKDPQGRPVSGTGVTLFQTKLEYVTDAEGKFTASLPSSDKMRYFFAVDKRRELVGVGRLAGEKQQVEINLVPARIVSGRVVDPDGRPVSGAQIAPLPMTCFHVLTDSKGRFDVGWSSEWAGNIKDFCLMARHPELNLAAVVDMAPEAKTIDIRLEPALTLRGTVEDLEGKPIQGAIVGLSLIKGWGAGTPVKDTVTDSQGRFELRALPQRQEYGVGANAEGYQRNAIKTGMLNRVAQVEEAGAIILKKPIFSTSGIVVDDSGKPVEGIPVYWRGEGQPLLESQTDAHGRFTFEKVCQGPVKINAKNQTFFGTVETQGDAKDIRLVVGPRFVPQPDGPNG